MHSLPDKGRLQAILESDRIWSAYALADLDPEHDAYADWYVGRESVLLRYTGLFPPVLFAHGTVTEISLLLDQIPPGEYQISFPADLLTLPLTQMEVLKQIPMWRMYYEAQPALPHPDTRTHRLYQEDLPEIERLYKGQPDAPDGFHPRQMQLGPFVGIKESEELVATAGVHVLSQNQNIAAVGNVFTHPRWRGKGYGKICTELVLDELVQRGIETIVLNVGQENERAIRLYQHVGFQIYCPFFEGLITIGEVPQVVQTKEGG
jgi:ribosomal protein S18 acetylase RimI-like enzyme